MSFPAEMSLRQPCQPCNNFAEHAPVDALPAQLESHQDEPAANEISVSVIKAKCSEMPELQVPAALVRSGSLLKPFVGFESTLRAQLHGLSHAVHDQVSSRCVRLEARPQTRDIIDIMLFSLIFTEHSEL